jgi:hypothetical protein
MNFPSTHCLKRVDFYEKHGSTELEAKENLACAIEWKKEEGVNEKLVTMVCIFKAKLDSILQAIKRASIRT